MGGACSSSSSDNHALHHSTVNSLATPGDKLRARPSVRSSDISAAVNELDMYNNGSEASLLATGDTPRSKSIHRSSIKSVKSRASVESDLSLPSDSTAKEKRHVSWKLPKDQRLETEHDDVASALPKTKMLKKGNSLRMRKPSNIVGSLVSRPKSEQPSKENFFELFDDEEREFAFAMSGPEDRPSSASLADTNWKSLRTLAAFYSQTDDEEDEENEEENQAIASAALDMAMPIKSPKADFAGRAKRAGQSIFRARSRSTVESAALNSQRRIAMTDSMVKLQVLIASQSMRRQLIQQMLTLRGDHSTRVRFIAAVDQFGVAQDSAEKKRLGDKIVSIFVRDEKGRFSVSLSEDTRKYLVQDGFLNFLPFARREVLEGLSQDDDVVKIVFSLGVAEQQHQKLMKTLSTAVMPKAGEAEAVMVEGE